MTDDDDRLAAWAAALRSLSGVVSGARGDLLDAEATIRGLRAHLASREVSLAAALRARDELLAEYRRLRAGSVPRCAKRWRP